MKVIGITGGVGSGKSKILQELKDKYNAYIIETDKLAHELMEPGKEAYIGIVNQFGEEVLAKEKPYPIDRTKLGNIVFNDKEKLALLNQIVHPAVKNNIISQINEKRSTGSCKLFVIEAALLIQDGYKSICDEIWTVYVEQEERIKRLMKQRGYTREKCISMFNSQDSEDFYKANSDFVINNQLSYEKTSKQLNVQLNKLLADDIMI